MPVKCTMLKMGGNHPKLPTIILLTGNLIEQLQRSLVQLQKLGESQREPANSRCSHVKHKPQLPPNWKDSKDKQILAIHM